MKNTLLEIRDLTVQLKQKKNTLNVLQNISFSISEGEIVGIVGESGCGKSVLSQTILGLQPPTMYKSAGDILYKNEAINYHHSKSLRALRGNEISMIFQNPMTSLNPSKKIGKQVSEMFRLHKKLSKQEAIEKTIQLLKSLGLSRSEQLIHDYPHQLSGGMQQRVMTAIALACQPKLLIADEPTTALDVTIQAQILALMKEACEKTNTAILLISHDLGVMANMCDRILVMYAGEIVEAGPTEQIIFAPQHPYTQGLLQSLPDAKKRHQKLVTIPGAVPKLDERLAGCAFASRCHLATEDCFASKPIIRKVADEHDVKCMLVQEEVVAHEPVLVASS